MRCGLKGKNFGFFGHQASRRLTGPRQVSHWCDWVSLREERPMEQLQLELLSELVTHGQTGQSTTVHQGNRVSRLK